MNHIDLELDGKPISWKTELDEIKKLDSEHFVIKDIDYEDKMASIDLKEDNFFAILNVSQ